MIQEINFHKVLPSDTLESLSSAIYLKKKLNRSIVTLSSGKGLVNNKNKINLQYQKFVKPGEYSQAIYVTNYDHTITYNVSCLLGQINLSEDPDEWMYTSPTEPGNDIITINDVEFPIVCNYHNIEPAVITCDKTDFNTLVGNEIVINFSNPVADYSSFKLSHVNVFIYDVNEDYGREIQFYINELQVPNQIRWLENMSEFSNLFEVTLSFVDEDDDTFSQGSNKVILTYTP